MVITKKMSIFAIHLHIIKYKGNKYTNQYEKIFP